MADPQAHLPMDDLHSSSDQALVSTLSGSPYTFLQPPPSLHLAALVLSKRYLDPLASSITEVQLQRQRDARKKRKRGEGGYSNGNGLLQLKEVHVDEGFSIDQVWAQAKRVLDATRDEVESELPQILQVNQHRDLESKARNDPLEDGKQLRMVRFDDDGFEVGGSDEDSLGEESVEDKEDDVLDDGEYMDDLEGNDSEALSQDVEDIEMDEDHLNGELLGAEEPTDTFKEDPNGLNDGFFSIDDFNKQSEFLERQDAAADPYDGAASDEEEIDWDADPMTAQPTVPHSRSSAVNEQADKTEVDEDDEGPTFGNTDLNAPESDSDAAQDDPDGFEDGLSSMPGMQNTNEIHYADFFAPPARKASKANNPRHLSHSQNLPPARFTQPTNSPPEDIQRTISAVRRDLFDDALSASESDSPTPLNPTTTPQSRRSTHERRQAALAEEIRRLEAANVAKREWTLSGEARASDRPLNSLLEEDLDFERAGKPVPVITASVSEDIETLIKRRILAQEFDEVRRRRPDSLVAPTNAAAATTTRRGRFELEDTRGKESLAEIYEREHLRRNDHEGRYGDKGGGGGGGGGGGEAGLEREYKEIETLWRDVCAKLDALCSWHYKPKQPAPSVRIVADVPVVKMEDARPSAGADIAASAGGGGETSMLAPQEVYAPGKEGGGAGGAGGGKGEVVTKSGMPVAKEEMSREEKLRRRRREKERIKKKKKSSGDGLGGTKKKKEESRKGEKEKRDVLGRLKSGGVRVIGRKGEVRDVEGREVRGMRGGRLGAGGFKL
ncbi:MAG: U3 snoRNP protein [Candelina submexicana]|nr:MAG: U3 snoRNP protein [Candelina submexicana]